MHELKGLAQVVPGSVVILYGSRAYDLQHSRSDYDLAVVNDSFSAEQRENLIAQVTDIHHRAGLPLDAEVPYESKLCVTWDDLAEAASGQHHLKDGVCAIPLIEKTDEFLGSRYMALRLWQDVLAGKVVCFPNDSRVAALQSAARVSFIKLYASLKDSVTLDELVDWLIAPPPIHWEMWLGFKPHPSVASFLREAFLVELEWLEGTEGAGLR